MLARTTLKMATTRAVRAPLTLPILTLYRLSRSPITTWHPPWPSPSCAPQAQQTAMEPFTSLTTKFVPARNPKKYVTLVSKDPNTTEVEHIIDGAVLRAAS